MSRLVHALLLLSAFALTGCANKAAIGSIVGGECQLMHTPEYAVKGATPYDQRWANKTTEALVEGCGQPRPKKRPASFDAPKVARATPAQPVASKPAPAKPPEAPKAVTAPTASEPAQPPKKKRFWEKWKRS